MQLDVAPLPRSPVPRSLLDEAETLTGALAALAERFPDYECLTILTRELREQRRPVGAIWRRAREIQSSLMEKRIDPGDFAIIVMPTGAELVAAYFGVMLAGGVPALVATPSHRLADRDAYIARVSAVLENAQARAIYTDDEVAEVFRTYRAALPSHTAILTPADAGPIASPRPIVPARPDEIATVQYSSGATGAPKGVLLSHRAVLNNIRGIRHCLELSPEDVSVNWIPLYHDMGLIDAFLLPLLSGCPTVLIPTVDFLREPALWLWTIHQYRGSVSWAPNFAYALCAKRIPEPALGGLDLSSWRVAISAAEPILAETVSAFCDRFARFGLQRRAFTPFYGLAENVTAVTAHPVDDEPLIEVVDRSALASRQLARPVGGDGVSTVGIGRPLPCCEVEIRDGAGRSLPERHVGVIWVRSNCLFSGYHRDPELTAQVLVDGWLNTGDRGYLANGHLFFVSREKDLIVVGGEKYAPHDIESAINRVPGVREGCAVAFGVINEKRGTEDIAAVVETRNTDERAVDGLRSAIRTEVMHETGLPLRYVILVPPGGIEKTTSGKLARSATQRRYADRLTG